jgi:Superinfection immunity protein
MFFRLLRRLDACRSRTKTFREVGMVGYLLFAQTNQGDATGGIVVLLGLACLAVIGLLFYFLPAFIAIMRGHQNAAAICVLNLLLGWTFLGWTVALVWSFTAVERRR